jgi:carnitine 3-dehydrogenase
LRKSVDEAWEPLTTSGLAPGANRDSIQSGCKQHPERCVLGHPFNPPHIIPLVEVVGGAKTSEAVIDRTMQFYASIGKKPIRLRKSVSGHSGTGCKPRSTERFSISSSKAS